MSRIKKAKNFNRLMTTVKIWGAKPVLGSLYEE